MTLDDDMNTAAAEYAQTLLNLSYLKHSDRESRSGQGENLAMGCSTGTEGIRPRCSEIMVHKNYVIYVNGACWFAFAFGYTVESLMTTALY